MAKNIVINVDNSLAGTVELWASAPMANGNRQTAPVFLSEKPFENGTVTLSGLQETPADKSWHYRIIVRPAGRECGSLEGSAQFRVFLPTTLPDTAYLTALPSAWQGSSQGTQYTWLGTPNNSASVKWVDGVEVARNIAPDPRCTSVSNYRVVGTLSSAEESGIPFIQVRRNLSQSGLYLDPSINFGTSEYEMSVGDIVTVSAEIRATKAFDLQVRINPYSGASVSYLDQPMTSLVPTDGWVRVSATASVSAISDSGYLRAFIRAFPDNASEGHGFDVRRYMIQKNTQETYFDGGM